MNFGAPELPRDKNVAAYCRVSYGRDAMLHSLEAQVSYYSGLIQGRSGWEYAGVYADEARTGTKDTRKNFVRLLEDCRAGKIDMVLTKSISRFARNTVTLLETVLASYAQEESRSASENQKWRIKKNFEEGKPWSSTLLGYRNVNGRYEVVPEEVSNEMEVVAGMIQRLVDENATQKLDQEDYRRKYAGYADRYAALESRMDSLKKERDRREIQHDLFSGFLSGLEEVRELPVDFSGKLFYRMVDFATVHSDGRVVFTFRNGAEVSTEI